MTESVEKKLKTLVRQAKAGDKTAFSEMVRLLMNQVAALTYRMTGDREISLDLAQESFITAWDKLDQFREEASFASWIYRIVANKSLNFLKSKSRTDTLIVSDFQEASSQNQNAESTNPEKLFIQNELKNNVLSFVQSLPPQQRLVFELRFYKQLSFAEISEFTERALGTVKTSYREAIIKLRQHSLEKGWKR